MRILHYFLKSTLGVILLCFFAHWSPLHGQAFVGFQHDSLIMDEGSQMTVCIELANANVSSNEYIVEVAFAGTSLPHFTGQQKKIITFQEKTFCFGLSAGLHHQSQTNAEYTLGLTVISTTGLSLGNRSELTIIVNNKQPTSVALGTKSLTFIAYDNQINTNGADRIAVMNTVPITPQTNFTLTSAEYDTAAGYNMWIGRSREALSAVEITYTGTTEIAIGSVIEFDIAHHPTLGDKVNNFEINNATTTAFTGVNVGDTTILNLDLSTSTGNSLYLVTGEFVPSQSQYMLMGRPIDAINVGYPSTSPPLPPSLDGNTVVVTQTGSTWGIIDCGDGEIYLCDFVGLTGNVQNWSIASGTSSNNLPADILNTICEPEGCPDGEITVEPNCSSEKADYIFLIDNSSSVGQSPNPTEYEDMHESIDATIIAIAASNPEARFAIAQFAHTDAFTISVEFTFDPYEAIDFEREHFGGTDVRAAVEDVIEAITSGPLELRPDAVFNFIIYTDAAAGDFNVEDDYDPYNEIKLHPHYSITSVVRYQGQIDGVSNPIAASISSPGGAYYGGLDYNSEDPDGNSQPRRLYIVEDFTDPLTDLLEDVTECSLLHATPDIPCSNPVYEWIASNGGEIISYNGAFIETNEEGTYVVTVLCSGECEYGGEYTYPQNQPLAIIPSSTRGVMVDGVFLSPAQYEQYIEGDLVVPKTTTIPGFSVQIIPNPNKGSFNVLIRSEVNDDVEISMETLSGITAWTKSYTIVEGDNSIYVNEPHIGDGMYLLRIEGMILRGIKKVVVTK